ncbi:MAG: tetratricopeptide repeat protein [Nibricoccus sp.]
MDSVQPTSVRSARIAPVYNLPLAVLLIVLTFVVYWPALRGDFVIDDAANVTKAELRSLQGLGRIWCELGVTQQYYPVLYTGFWLEHCLWGDSTIGYHLANVVQHLVAAGLLILIVRRLSLPGAWLAGFLFALHPVSVESVAWIAEQKNTLSTVFFLASALVYFDFAETRKRSAYCLALAFFVLALLSKTVTATLPAALLVVIWWQRGRLDVRRDFLPLLPWFVIGATVGLFSAWVEHRFVGAQGEDFSLNFLERTLVAGRAVWFYLGKLVWPADLMFMYPRWTIDAGVWWQFLFPLGVIGLIVAALVVARRHPGPLASLLLFCGLLFPTAGFLNIYWFKISYVADHFAYLASIAVIVPTAGLLTSTFHRMRSGAWFGPTFNATLVISLGILSWQRSHIYRDHKTLCEHTLTQNPEAWMMHNNLGFILGEQFNQIPEAIEHFKTAVRLKPNFADAHFNLGRGWERMPNHLQEALSEYRESVRLQPNDVESQFRLGCVLGNLNQVAEAMKCFQAAVVLRPDHAEAHFNLALALGEISRDVGEIIAHLAAAIRAKPDYVDAYYLLGNTLAGNGRLPEAVEAYRAALRFAPDFVEGHFNLGCVLTDLQHPAEALAEFETVLRLQPGFEAARDMRTKLISAKQ